MLLLNENSKLNITIFKISKVKTSPDEIKPILTSPFILYDSPPISRSQLEYGSPILIATANFKRPLHTAYNPVAQLVFF